VSFIGLLLTLFGGWFGWSGWWSILFGGLMFFGAHRAIPEQSGRINAVGLPIYIIGSFVIMSVIGWIASLF
jgi:hypothetical protein